MGFQLSMNNGKIFTMHTVSPSFYSSSDAKILLKNKELLDACGYFSEFSPKFNIN